MRDTQGSEDIFLDVIIKWAFRYPLNDATRKVCSIVRIGWNSSRGKDLIRLVSGHKRAQWNQLARLVDDQVFEDLLKPRGVSHKIPQGHRSTKRVWNLEIKVIVDIAIQVYFSSLHQLHDCGPSECFGNRSGADQSHSRGYGNFPLHVREPVAFGKKNVAVLHDYDYGSGNVFAQELQGNQTIEKGFDVARGHFVTCFGRCARGGDWGLGRLGRFRNLRVCRKTAQGEQTQGRCHAAPIHCDG